MTSSDSSSVSCMSSLLSCIPWKGAENQLLQLSLEEKTEGRRKLRRDQSSVRLFWIGVPGGVRRVRRVGRWVVWL